MLLAVVAAFSFSAMSAPAAEATPLTYFGGQVVNQPNVHLIFWGSSWNAHADVRSAVESEFGAISGSPWQGVMTQYFDGEGAISSQITTSSWTDESITAPSLSKYEQFESEIEYSTTKTGWPLGGMNNVYMIFPAPGTKYAEGDAGEGRPIVAGCGEHRFSNRIGSTFGRVLWPPDNPSKENKNETEKEKKEKEAANHKLCAVPGGPETYLAAVTETAAHEYAEAITDPVTMSATGGQKTGWIDASSNNDEIADKCEGNYGQLANGTSVQMLWSNAQNACSMSFSLPPSPPIPVSEDNTTGPRVLATPGGTVETYFRSTSGKLGHQWYVQGSGWGVEEQPGSMAVNAIPRVTKQGSGITDVFFRTASNELGHDWWAPGIGWGNEVRPDSVSTDPTVVAQENGTVDIFYRTASGELGHDSYVQANGWSHEVRPASIAAGADPVAIGQSNGTVDIFWRESNGYLGHHSYVQGSGWAVQTMAASIAQGADPVVQNEGGGAVGVYFRTSANELGHYWYRPYIGWATETRPGPIASDPQVTYLNGVTNIFFRTPSGELGHEWFTAGGWEREIRSVQMASAPHVTSQANGTVNVFYRTPAGELGHDWYVQGNGWAHEVRFAQMGSDPHPVAQENGTVDIFWRTITGTLGHHSYVPGNGWSTENRPATMSARPPLDSTGAASSISTTGATLNGTVNPERSPTTYYFQYGTTTSYGSTTSTAEAGSGHETVAASRSLSTLSAGTTYHYRLVATGPEGSTYGGDQSFKTASTNVKAGIEALPLIQPFDGSAGSKTNFLDATKWAALGWAAAKGVETTSGWGPSAAFPNVAGTYYNTSLAAGKMPAASVVMNVSPGIAERYFSLWIDTGSPTATSRNGYEARVTYLGTSGSNYSLVISRWQAGVRTVLATIASTSYLPSAAVALVDEGSTLSLWGVVSGSAINMLNATDSTFSSGYTGIEAAGNYTRLGNFKAGGI
jgi:hypothetical protein